MKKTLFLLTCITGLLSLVGCSKDETYSSSGNTTKSTKIRWYGVNSPSDITIRGVTDKAKLWNQNTGIPIKFINNPTDVDMILKIKAIAAEWERYAGIRFKYVDNDQNASVRIAFDWNGNDWLTWSYTGTDAKYVRSQAEPTVVFGGLQYQDDEQFKGDVLRVFGQILGLEYEQRHQDWDFWRSEAQLQRYWEGMFEGMNMDWNEIKDYVFNPLSGENSIFPTQTSEVDELSVMAWPYYARTQVTNLVANFELSEGDKTFIAKLYPKESETLPTIQEAWVDTGYFTWTDDTKTALKITYQGANQEYLPDVNDGEQLTSAFEMFLDSKILEAPTFNTSNVTNFSWMFKSCGLLKTIPQYNTSKGENFSYMFNGCLELTDIPYMDTSNGINLIALFGSCHSLKTIPPINTSKATSFESMFAGCFIITSIPPLDTSNGVNFKGMFSWCVDLKTIPLIDTSKATNFEEMFSNCFSLTSIPLLDTSKGSFFVEMFANCNSLHEKPNLDLSSASRTDNMYKGTPFENSL